MLLSLPTTARSRSPPTILATPSRLIARPANLALSSRSKSRTYHSHSRSPTLVLPHLRRCESLATHRITQLGLIFPLPPPRPSALIAIMVDYHIMKAFEFSHIPRL